MFVADIGNNRVLRFASLDSLSNGEAAEVVLGQPDFTSNTGASGASGMAGPSGVVISSDGILWVVDTGNSRVLRFDDASSLPDGAPADGVLGQRDFASNTTATSATGMKFPYGVTIGSDGTLWVADTNNHRVLRFDNAASKPNGAAADGVIGQSSFTSRTSATSAIGMNFPYGVAIGSDGTLWVADASNSRVLRFADAANKPAGAAADGVLGQPDFASNTPATSATGMKLPYGVAIGSDDTLWVVEQFNHRVLRFANATSKPDGAAADGVLGQADFTSDTFATSASGMSHPSGVAIIPDGTLWVADSANDRVLRFANAASKPDGAPADGVLGQPDFISREGTPSATEMNSALGVAVDPGSGKVFVADTFNHRVLRFASLSRLRNGEAAEVVLGQPDFTSNVPASGASGMSYPVGVAIGSDGTLWVADASNSRVLRFADAASKPTGTAADGVLGQADFTSNTSATSATGMAGPTGVAIGSDGTLWVADASNSRVLRFANATSKPDGAAADGVLGQPDFASNTPVTSATGIHGPAGLAIDSGGTLWLADTGNHRVLRFADAASKPNGAAADGVLGQSDFASNTPATSATGTRDPVGLAIDSGGTLWVADSSNYRVLRFANAANKPDGAAADGVLGQSTFTSRTAATSATGMDFPYGIAVNSGTETLWVTDFYNDRVLHFGPLPGSEPTATTTNTPQPTATATATAVVNPTSSATASPATATAVVNPTSSATATAVVNSTSSATATAATATPSVASTPPAPTTTASATIPVTSATATGVPVAPTATISATSAPPAPTATPTATMPVPNATATGTATGIPPAPTATSVPPAPTATPSATMPVPSATATTTVTVAVPSATATHCHRHAACTHRSASPAPTATPTATMPVPSATGHDRHQCVTCTNCYAHRHHARAECNRHRHCHRHAACTHRYQRATCTNCYAHRHYTGAECNRHDYRHDYCHHSGAECIRHGYCHHSGAECIRHDYCHHSGAECIRHGYCHQCVPCTKRYGTPDHPDHPDRPERGRPGEFVPRHR